MRRASWRMIGGLLVVGTLGFVAGRTGDNEPGNRTERKSSLSASERLSQGGTGVLLLAGSDFEIADQILRLVEAVGPGGYARAWKALAELPRTRRARLQNIVMRWWGAADGPAAMEAADRDWHLTKLAMEGWGSTAPEEALVFSRTKACAGLTSLDSEIVAGMWKEDPDRATAFALRHGIRFPGKIYRLWVQQDPRAAITHALNGLGDVYSIRSEIVAGWSPPDIAAELVWLTELEGLRSSIVRDALMAELVSTMDGSQANAVLDAILDSSTSSSHRSWLAPWALQGWIQTDPVAARRWVMEFPVDHALRIRVVRKALDMNLFEDRTVVGQLVNELPVEQREYAILDGLGGNSSIGLTEGLARVDSWREELGEEDYAHALEDVLEKSRYQDPASFIEGLDEMARRLPEESRIEIIRRFGRRHPIEATQWMMSSNVSGSGRYYGLLGTLEPWLRIDPVAAGNFMESLQGDDRMTGARAIVNARLPANRERQLREQLGLGPDDGKESVE